MKRSQQTSRSFYRVGRIRYAAAVAAMMLSASGLIGAAIDARAESPAGHDQAVIAQGIAAVPNGELGWRVLQRSVDASGGEQDITGFVIADDGDVIVADDGGRTKLDERDGAAEASFVFGDHSVAAVEAEASYLEIALVGSQEAITGESFQLTGSEREFSLVQGDLDAGDEVEFQTSGFPILLVNTSGSLLVDQDGGVSGQLADHNAVLLDANEVATVSAPNGDASYVAVYIGDEVAAEPESVPTQAPGGSQESGPQPIMPPAPTATAGKDSDNDGLDDDGEALRGTDPNNPDSDNDGLYDGYEVYDSGTVPTMFDTDGDGFGDGDEIYTFGTNPSSTDTDGDGLNDYLEAHDYLTDATNPDTDGDGLTDYEEISVYFTDPMVADSDADGVSDSDEVANGTNPNNAGDF